MKKTLGAYSSSIKDSLMVVYRSARCGLIWAGQAKFFKTALTFEAYQETEYESYREFDTVTITGA